MKALVVRTACGGVADILWQVRGFGGNHLAGTTYKNPGRMEMFCPTCGAGQAEGMKYCNRCGSNLATRDQADEIEVAEKRLRDELVDLFWATAISLGLILGGMLLINNAMRLSDWILVAYLILSSSAFAVNFALGLWQVRRFARLVLEARSGLATRLAGAGQLTVENLRGTLEPVPSITEGTTRSLDAVTKEQLTD